MKRLVAEWVWRVAVLCALGVIGWQLERIHAAIAQPADAQADIAAAPDPVQDSLDGLRDDVSQLAQKVDAILVVMARSR